MECSCCGNDRENVVALRCHDDVKICPGCIDWLHHQTGQADSTPILSVTDMPAAIAFYEQAGFSTHEYEPGGGYTFVAYDDENVFDLALDGKSGCYLLVPDVDAWHARLVAGGITATDPDNYEYGMREFEFIDPSGNSVRVGTPTG
jgi:uncharacterized glyoxalase superfamily protein PhnB